MRIKLVLIFVIPILAACNDMRQHEVEKATAYLRNDPTASSTDGVTFSDIGYWKSACRNKNAVWVAAVKTCSESGQHPPVCQMISSVGSACP